MVGDNKDTCGIPLSSSCVSYQGEFAGAIKESEFSCNVNLNDIIKKVGLILQSLKDNDSVSNVKLVELTDSVTDIKAGLELVNTKLANLDANDIYVNIDLGCLAPSATSCEVSNKKYKLLNILQLFKNEICSLKA